MSPTIRIDDDVYEKLKEQAEPFVDTPNTVLRRLLGFDAAGQPEDETVDVAELEPASGAAPKVRGAKPTLTKPPRQPVARAGKKTKRSRVPNGSLLPETEYDRPLLETLVEFGGSASSRAVVDAVGVKVKNQLTDLDLEKLPSGGIRWENRLQFVRLRLIEKGFMIKESGRGIWAISDEGRKFVATPGEA